MVLVAIQPDLGNAAVIVLTTVVMFPISGVGYRWFTALAHAGIVGISSSLPWFNCLGFGVQTMAKVPYLRLCCKRFTSIFNPFKDLTRIWSSAISFIYAMVMGGWFSLGLGNSIENGSLRKLQQTLCFKLSLKKS